MYTLSVSEARKQLFELRRRAVEDCEPSVLTHKDGNVVLLSLEEWESYQETARLLRDKQALRALLESFEDRKKGRRRGKSIQDIFSDLV